MNLLKESDEELWLVSVYCWVENDFHAELYLQQNRKHTLDKIPEMFLNCEQNSYQVTFLIYKKLLFSIYPTDLVNSKTTIPLRVCEQR